MYETAKQPQVEEKGPQLLLLDLNLGNRMSGLDLLKELRKHPATNQLPIILLTVSQQESDIKASYQDGASSFIRKPETYVYCTAR